MIWILFTGTMALSLWAMWRLNSVYRRHSQGVVRSGLGGGQVAAHILRRAGINDVEITVGEGMLGDHHDPIHKPPTARRSGCNGSGPTPRPGMAVDPPANPWRDRTSSAAPTPPFNP